MSAIEWPMPAVTTRADGQTRLVGVELELQGVDVRDLAELTARTLGGEIEAVSEAEYSVHVADRGTYRVEVDYALLKEMARESHESGDESDSMFDSVALGVLSAVSNVAVPSEIVTPPLPMDTIAPDLHRLTVAIREAGGRGTRLSPLYAFGLHLNVEPPDMEAATVIAYIKAFVCLFDWLVWKGEVDLSRRATPYIKRYPGDYEELVTDPDYWPDWDTLIVDYLRLNASRNRALDMLPMLAELNGPAVRLAVDDDRVKARPAFHYRLANCAIDEPGWSIEQPWRRWLRIEDLAASRERLDEICDQFRKDRKRVLHRLDNSWRETVERWLSDS